MIRLPQLALLLLLAACASTPTGNKLDKTITWVGPVFMTLDDERPTVRAITTDGAGKILALLDEAPAASTASNELRTLPGALALPGLHDAHIHVLGIGRQSERVDLLNSASPADAKARAQRFLDENPGVSVVHGRGWDQSLWPDKAFPTAADLDGLTDKPVLLRRVDGHAAWVNAAMLKLAGITRDTPDPEGGRIVKDDKGEPTGVLVDAAMDVLYTKLPASTQADYARWLRAGLLACARGGLVAVHDMGFPVEAVAALEALDAEWALPVRVFLYLDGSDPKALAALQREHAYRGDVELRGIKLLADGAMGSRGAALLEDYSDEPGNTGLLQMKQDELSAKVGAVHALGKQAAVHAIGDRGNRTTLNAFEAAQGTDASRRHRLEHAQMIHEDDFERLVPLGVILSMQPTHATSDMRWAEQRVGAGRILGTYAWRRVLQLGAPLAFGSDAPVENHTVAWGLYSAVTRSDHKGEPAGGWRMDQALKLEEAARAFSAGAAYAVHREGSIGKLAPGYALDLTVYEVDAREDPAKWLDNPVSVVVTGGQPFPLPAGG